MLVLTTLQSWLFPSPELGSIEGGSSRSCSHAEVQGCILLYFLCQEERSSRLSCSLAAEGNLGHDSGILHQPVLSPALPKAASSVSEAFKQMPSESRIEMV